MKNAQLLYTESIMINTETNEETVLNRCLVSTITMGQTKLIAQKLISEGCTFKSFNKKIDIFDLVKSKTSLNGTYIQVLDSNNNEIGTISFCAKKRVWVSQIKDTMATILNMSKYQ